MNGKGDTYRPVDQKKYERNWLRIFGKKCPKCKGLTGLVKGIVCKTCNNIGFVEKKQ